MPYGRILPPALKLPRKPGLAVSVGVVVACVLAYAALRLGVVNRERPVPVSFTLLLVPFVWVRRRGMLWLAAVAYAVIVGLERFSPYFFYEFTHRGNVTNDAIVVDYMLFVINVFAVTMLLHVLISVVDVADRRAAMLGRLNAELSAVWRTAPVGLAITNDDQSDVRVNPAGSAMLGVPPEENVAALLASGRVATFRGGALIPTSHAPLARAAREDAFIEAAEWELAGPSGRRITVLLAAAPVREHDVRLLNGGDRADAPARASGAVAAFVDISAAKQLQRELDLRRREAEEASVRKSRFLSAVSHDIRTPANAISLLAELLGRASSTPGMADEIPRFASDLRASSQKLVELVSDVLDFSKLDSSRVEVVETVFDLGALLKEEVVQASVVAGTKGLPVKLAPLEQKVSLRTDRVKLGRIVGNLLSNAVKFTVAGEVSLSVSRNPVGDLLVRVADSGHGIPSDSLSRIFDEFYQVRANTSSSDPAKNGSGLGLAICRRLSAAMGMRLDVESTVGVGTTFTLTIPNAITILPTRETA